MKIGIVGYQGSGKSTLFHWLTEVAPDPALSHLTQSAMASIPDERIAALCEVYHPKKITRASLEIVDTPGLSRTHEGSAAKLGLIREASCLIVVVAAYDHSDPLADLRNFEDDLLIADLDIVSGRVHRLRETVKKPRPDREEQQQELDALEPLLEVLESGRALRELKLTPEQDKATRSFQLLTGKTRLVIINSGDEPVDIDLPETSSIAVSLGMQLELSTMPQEEREDFCREMEVQIFDRDSLIQEIMKASGQMLFFTAGDKEVRSWLIPQGATAVEAADNIHSDIARGFIRAETMSCEDITRLGSEREVKAQNLMRHELKDYVIQDGDVLHMRFNV